MVYKATITRRAAIVGAAASCFTAAMAMADPLPEATPTAALPRASVYEITTALMAAFDSATYQGQCELIAALRGHGGTLSKIGDVLADRQSLGWVWIPTHIPGLPVPSNV